MSKATNRAQVQQARQAAPAPKVEQVAQAEVIEEVIDPNESLGFSTFLNGVMAHHYFPNAKRIHEVRKERDFFDKVGFEAKLFSHDVVDVAFAVGRGTKNAIKQIVTSPIQTVKDIGSFGFLVAYEIGDGAQRLVGSTLNIGDYSEENIRKRTAKQMAAVVETYNKSLVGGMVKAEMEASDRDANLAVWDAMRKGFATIWDKVTNEIQFSGAWSNNTGYLDFIFADSVFDQLNPGTLVRSIDDKGRKMIIIKTPQDLVVVFQRYPKEDSELTYQTTALALTSMSEGLSTATSEVNPAIFHYLFGSLADYRNIGSRLAFPDDKLPGQDILNAAAQNGISPEQKLLNIV